MRAREWIAERAAIARGEGSSGQDFKIKQRKPPVAPETGTASELCDDFFGRLMKVAEGSRSFLYGAHEVDGVQREQTTDKMRKGREAPLSKSAGGGSRSFLYGVHEVDGVQERQTTDFR